MDEQRKYAILFFATILAGRKLVELDDMPSPAAREACIANAIVNAERILTRNDRPCPANRVPSKN
jgi:hypothetical protein